MAMPETAGKQQTEALTRAWDWAESAEEHVRHDRWEEAHACTAVAQTWALIADAATVIEDSDIVGTPAHRR